MPDPVIVELNFAHGTLWATSDSGNLRAYHGTQVTWVADFPFRIESANLTGSKPGPNGSAKPASGRFAFPFTLDAGGPVSASDVAPSYKYTIKGDGDASGKVLDPIIIVDRR
jgi:hypothetical protein